MFYIDNIKIVPGNLEKYLTPLALATLFLSYPGINRIRRLKNGRRVPIVASVEDLKYLSVILKSKYNIETILYPLSGLLYIHNSRKKKSREKFSKIVKPHLLHSQHYLLNKPIVKIN